MERDSGTIARWALALVFIYHGLVPKILVLSPVEVQMILAHGRELPAKHIAVLAGVAEVALGLAFIVLRRQLWPVWVALAAFTLLLMDVALFSPALLVEAFSPVSTNIAGIGLCLVVLRQHPRVGL